MTEFFNHLLKEFNLPLQNPVLIFSLILFIILLSPILLRRFNIPGIIGLILSGVLIGPHGFGILENNSAIELFSTIGVLYIMFIAGLELDLNDFRSHRNKSVVFGILTFALPITVGFPVCRYLLGYDFNASLLTSSMFATHTLVAYPIVSKLGISKNQAVAITVGGTILTDSAVLILLAVIMGSNAGELSFDFWVKLGVSLLIFSAIMFIIIPRVARWFFRKLESEKHSHYIFVLSVVFFAAFLAEEAGVESIIGAFVAGLALNKLIPHTSALMNRIEFIGNSLFIPFFLISVGMLVDIKVVFNGPGAIIVALTLSIAALFGKWIAAYVTQKIYKFKSSERQLIFGLSSAHAAATLAVILVGFRAGILDENILNGTIILILITCIIASFATEKASKKLILETSSNNAGSRPLNNGIEHILIPAPNIERIEKLIDFAILVKDKKSANPLSILSVVSNNDEAEINILKSKSELENFVKQGSASETKVNIVSTIDHNISSGISRISRELMTSIIVLGWPKQKGFFEKLIGESLEIFVSNTDKTIFVCSFLKPINLHRRISIILPPLGEREFGFTTWFIKVAKLAQELSIPINIYGNKVSNVLVEEYISAAKLNVTLHLIEFNEFEDFLIISKYIREDDLLVFASARKGSPSYIGFMDTVPAKLEKHFSSVSKILVYPKEFDPRHIGDSYEDFSSQPINKGIETFQKLGKEIGSIFKKS